MLDAIVDRLNAVRRSRNEDPIELSSTSFVFDSDVEYGAQIRVAADALQAADDMERTLSESARGASWVHGNLIFTETGEPIVTIAWGADVGNPDPTVNVSIERRTLRVNRT